MKNEKDREVKVENDRGRGRRKTLRKAGKWRGLREVDTEVER